MTRRAAVDSRQRKGQHLQNVKALPIFTERELTRALRDAIIAEEGAINQYETVVDSSSNAAVKEVLQDIANEERVHVFELQSLLDSLLDDEKELREEGYEEVEDMDLAKVASRVAASLDDYAPEVIDAVEAYGDANEFGIRGRHLKWRGGWLSGSQLIEVVKTAVPEGYNDFEWKKLAKLVRRFPGYKYSFAREGSPAVYVKGFSSSDDLDLLADMAALAGADEVSFDSGSDTVWVSWGDKTEPSETPELVGKGNLEMRMWWD